MVNRCYSSAAHSFACGSGWYKGRHGPDIEFAGFVAVATVKFTEIEAGMPSQVTVMLCGPVPQGMTLVIQPPCVPVA